MKRSRDKDGTQAELLSAVQRVIEQDGVAGLGVNAVAREAGVDKVLIYRYFGGLEGLLTAFAESAAFWPTVAEIVVDRSALDAMSLGDAVAEVMVRYARALRKRPLTLAVLAGEVASRSPFHAPLEAAREQFGRALGELVQARIPPGVDLEAVTAIASAAVHYLALRARFIKRYNGVAIDEDAGWRRLEAAMTAMIRGAIAPRAAVQSRR